MMRRPQNYGYEPVPQNAANDDLEVENERLAEDLKNKISNLKSLTIDIGELEVSSVDHDSFREFQGTKSDIKTSY